MCADPNSVFNVAFVDAYNIFCLIVAESGIQLISNQANPNGVFASNLKMSLKKQVPLLSLRQLW